MTVEVRLREIERTKNKLERQSNWKGKKTRRAQTYKKKMSSVLGIIFI